MSPDMITTSTIHARRVRAGWGVGGGEVERRSGELMSTPVLGLRVITGCYHE